MKFAQPAWLIPLVLLPLLGVAAVLGGVVVSYDSFYWWPSHRALPVSFCVVSVVVLEVTGVNLVRSMASRRDATEGR